MVDAFLDEFRAIVTSIEERPLMYPAISGEVRRGLMTRFSYAIYLLSMTKRSRFTQSFTRRGTKTDGSGACRPQSPDLLASKVRFHAG